MNRIAVTALSLIVTTAAACNGRLDEEAPPAPPDTAEPQGVTDPGGEPPPADLLLPDLDAYETDDSAEPGELEASLDHGAVGYEEVRRRLILGDHGFAQAEVTVVTFPAGSGGGQAYLDHRYGPAPRSPERVGGTEMLLVEADPHPALAWVTPTFVMTFERGAGVSMEWLRGLAQETVEQVSKALR